MKTSIFYIIQILLCITFLLSGNIQLSAAEYDNPTLVFATMRTDMNNVVKGETCDNILKIVQLDESDINLSKKLRDLKTILQQVATKIVGMKNTRDEIALAMSKAFGLNNYTLSEENLWKVVILMDNNCQNSVRDNGKEYIISFQQSKKLPPINDYNKKAENYSLSKAYFDGSNLILEGTNLSVFTNWIVGDASCKGNLLDLGVTTNNETKLVFTKPSSCLQNSSGKSIVLSGEKDNKIFYSDYAPLGKSILNIIITGEYIPNTVISNNEITVAKPDKTLNQINTGDKSLIAKKDVSKNFVNNVTNIKTGFDFGYLLIAAFIISATLLISLRYKGPQKS